VPICGLLTNMNSPVRQARTNSCMTLRPVEFGILVLAVQCLPVGEERAAFAKLHNWDSGDNTFLRQAPRLSLVAAYATIPAALQTIGLKAHSAPESTQQTGRRAQNHHQWPLAKPSGALATGSTGAVRGRA